MRSTTEMATEGWRERGTMRSTRAQVSTPKQPGVMHYRSTAQQTDGTLCGVTGQFTGRADEVTCKRCHGLITKGVPSA